MVSHTGIYTVASSKYVQGVLSAQRLSAVTLETVRRLQIVQSVYTLHKAALHCGENKFESPHGEKQRVKPDAVLTAPMRAHQIASLPHCALSSSQRQPTTEAIA